MNKQKFICPNCKESLVVVPEHEFKIISDPELMHQIYMSKKQVIEGKTKSIKELEKELVS